MLVASIGPFILFQINKSVNFGMENPQSELQKLLVIVHICWRY